MACVANQSKCPDLLKHSDIITSRYSQTCRYSLTFRYLQTSRYTKRIHRKVERTVGASMSTRIPNKRNHEKKESATQDRSKQSQCHYQDFSSAKKHKTEADEIGKMRMQMCELKKRNATLRAENDDLRRELSEKDNRLNLAQTTFACTVEMLSNQKNEQKLIADDLKQKLSEQQFLNSAREQLIGQLEARVARASERARKEERDRLNDMEAYVQFVENAEEALQVQRNAYFASRELMEKLDKCMYCHRGLATRRICNTKTCKPALCKQCLDDPRTQNPEVCKCLICGTSRFGVMNELFGDSSTEDDELVEMVN